MENPSASFSTPATSSDNPSIMTPQPVRHEQGKFSKDETDFLKSHLPAYGVLCQQLAKQATGPRGTGLVKGSKKDWVLTKVYPEFVKQYSSDQNGGPQLQSLQAVSHLLLYVTIARILVENIAMVHKPFTTSKFRFGFNSINCHLSF
jgi:hypothetical protein